MKYMVVEKVESEITYVEKVGVFDANLNGS